MKKWGERGLLRRQRVSELWARFKAFEGRFACVWYWKITAIELNLSSGHGAGIGCLLVAGQSICAPFFLLVEVVWDKSRNIL